MKRLIPFAVACLLLAGCASTPTFYQPSTGPGVPGFSEYRIEPGRYRVTFVGGPGAPARSLSGGNLQKFLVGREIDAAPRLLVVSQPTWGVDVGAAARIRGELLALRDAGCAVLVVSEDLDELLELSDRLVVMARGRVSPPVEASTASAERLGQWMSGLWAAAPDGGGAHVAA